MCALGARDRLVGRSHECDYPGRRAAAAGADGAQVQGRGHQRRDRRARARHRARRPLGLSRRRGGAEAALAPDVIVTQDHCEVCAVSLSDVEAATCTWTGRPVEIVSLKPDSHADVYADIAPRRARARDGGGRRGAGARYAAPARRGRARGCRPGEAARGLHRVGGAADGRRQLDARADRDRRRPQPVRRRPASIPTGCSGPSWSPPTPR